MAIPLSPLTSAEQSPYEGVGCTMQDKGRVVYIMDTQTGVIRYKSKLVRLTRMSPRTFDPGSSSFHDMKGSGIVLDFTPTGRSTKSREREIQPVRVRVQSGGKSETFTSRLVCGA